MRRNEKQVDTIENLVPIIEKLVTFIENLVPTIENLMTINDNFMPTIHNLMNTIEKYVTLNDFLLQFHGPTLPLINIVNQP